MRSTLTIFLLACLAGMTHAQFSQGQGPVPAYSPAAPAKGQVLPAVLTQKQLADQGYTQAAIMNAYKAAARVPNVLYQEPCYCYCDRNHGHKNLHSCFESTHGAGCGVCLAEALYSYQMSKKGWSAKQIRDGIIRGDFRQIDLENPPAVN